MAPRSPRQWVHQASAMLVGTSGGCFRPLQTQNSWPSILLYIIGTGSVCPNLDTNRQRTPFVHVGAPVHTELTNLRRAVLHRSRKWTEPTRADIEVDADLLGTGPSAELQLKRSVATSFLPNLVLPVLLGVLWLRILPEGSRCKDRSHVIEAGQAEGIRNQRASSWP